MDRYLIYILLGAVALALVLLVALLILFRRQKGGSQDGKIDELAVNLAALKAVLDSGLNAVNQSVSDHAARLQNAVSDSKSDMLKNHSDQQQKLFTALSEQNSRINKSLADQQQKLFDSLNAQTEKTNQTLSDNLDKLQKSNEQKLEQMRMTVDEKLQKTLNERIDSSFKNVSEQLENLYKSMGEMKSLSSGVSDLQRLLTNVKARGTWAEVQLGEILEQFLTADQFCRNVSTKHNSDFVEYAVKIPSRENDGEFILLPIDSKFPQEDYLRLQQAADNCDKAAVEEAAKALAKIVKDEAAKISKLYINVPETTGFAIMFLPTEGLYAEVLRRDGLIEEIQRKYSIMICGPTTISAFLNTLRVGFRTIAIDKQQAEVWKILGAAKQQYDLFEKALDNAKKKIDAAGSALDKASDRNRIIQKNLKKVESVSDSDSADILGIAADAGAAVFDDGAEDGAV